MRAALISVTERGAALSAELADLGVCACVRYAHEAHADAIAVPFSSVYDVTAELFVAYDALVYIGAAGIAVRAIAPHIRSKAADPAVLVIDEQGRFVIPVLSGHLGGANALAEAIAAKLGAVPVITTATDIGGRFSPDSFAAANFLHITDLSAAKAVAAAVLAGEPIGLVSDFPFENCPPELHPGENCRVGLCIGYDTEKKPFPVTLSLVPQDLVLGIGCRRGVSAAQIAEQVERSGIPLERVRIVSTIDRKADEPGLLAFCREQRLKLVTCTAAVLAKVAGAFRGSDFVQETIGVDNVCERSAVCVSGGALVYPKCAGNGVTCAAAACEIRLDFAKRRDIS